MRKRGESGSASKLARLRRAVAVSLAALVLAGCVAQDPPGSDYVEDVQNDFETGDYFNP